MEQMYIYNFRTFRSELVATMKSFYRLFRDLVSLSWLIIYKDIYWVEVTLCIKLEVFILVHEKKHLQMKEYSSILHD